VRALLEQAGAEVEWVPHGGQHEIPYPVLERLAALVRRCFPQF
jgi:phospholipase/carboxylesterase